MKLPEVSRDTKIDLASAFAAAIATTLVRTTAKSRGITQKRKRKDKKDKVYVTDQAALTASLCGMAAGAVINLFLRRA